MAHVTTKADKNIYANSAVLSSNGSKQKDYAPVAITKDILSNNIIIMHDISHHVPHEYKEYLGLVLFLAGVFAGLWLLSGQIGL